MKLTKKSQLIGEFRALRSIINEAQDYLCNNLSEEETVLNYGSELANQYGGTLDAIAESICNIELSLNGIIEDENKTKKIKSKIT